MFDNCNITIVTDIGQLLSQKKGRHQYSNYRLRQVRTGYRGEKGGGLGVERFEGEKGLYF